MAYSLNDKTVLRAGYGLWAGQLHSRLSGFYIQGYNSSNFRDSPDGINPYFILQDGWPASQFPAPPFIDPSYGFNSGVHVLDRDDAHPPYLQNWTLNIQRQLPGQILLDVAYVGNKGTRLQSHLMPTNQMDPRYLSLRELLFTDIADPAVQALPVVQAMPIDPAPAIMFWQISRHYARNTTLGQALRPPQYTQFDDYHWSRRLTKERGFQPTALQVKVDKRFRRD